MGLKFNPLAFSGFDIVPAGSTTTWTAPVADEASLPASGSAGETKIVLDTDHIYVWDITSTQWIDTGLTTTSFGSTPNANGYSILQVDKGNNVTATRIEIQPADSSNPGGISTSAQSFAGNKTFDNNVIVTGDLTVNGTTTTINTSTLEVTDANITINNSGNDATSEGSGLTIERTGTDGSFVYEDALASKFKLGAAAAESEVITAGHVQTITANKTLSGTLTLSSLTASRVLKLDGSNEIVSSTIVNADIDASAAIDATKIADGTVTSAEFQFINTVTSNVQTQLNNKQPLDSTLTSLAAYNTNGILTQTAADTFVGRTITAGSTNVTVADGDGVSDNPTIDVDTSLILGAAEPSIGDVKETEVAIAESQTATTIFSLNASARSAYVVVSAFIDATANVASIHRIDTVYDGTNWITAVNKTGTDDILIDVDVSGNIIYDSTTYAGFVGASSKFKYRVISTTS